MCLGEWSDLIETQDLVDVAKLPDVEQENDESLPVTTYRLNSGCNSGKDLRANRDV